MGWVVKAGWQFRTESVVALFNLATVGTVFLLQIIVLRMANGSRDADAYFATAAISQIALSIAVHVVTGAVIPQLARLNKRTRSAAVWAMLLLVIGVGLPIAALLYFTAPLWTFAIFPGFANEGAQNSIRLAALAALATPFAIATCVLSGYLYAQRRFVINEGISLATGVALALAAAVIIPKAGIVALGWLVLGRFVIQVLLLSAFLPAPNLHTPLSFLMNVFRKIRVLFIGALYFKSDLLVDRYLLSFAPAGALSMVVFGQSIFVAGSGVLGQSLANTASPTLSIAHSAGDEQAFRATLRRNLMMIFTASILFLVVSVIIVPPVTSILIQRQDVGGVDLRWVLILFGGVPVGACVGSLFANAFYAMGDTRTPTVMTASTFTIFLAAKLVVFIYFGVYAFCALTSIYYLSNAGLMAWLLRGRMRREFAL